MVVSRAFLSMPYIYLGSCGGTTMSQRIRTGSSIMIRVRNCFPHKHRVFLASTSSFPAYCLANQMPGTKNATWAIQQPIFGIVLTLPSAKPARWSNPLKTPLRPLSEAAISVLASDWSGGREEKVDSKKDSLPKCVNLNFLVFCPSPSSSRNAQPNDERPSLDRPRRNAAYASPPSPSPAMMYYLPPLLWAGIRGPSFANLCTFHLGVFSVFNKSLGSFMQSW